MIRWIAVAALAAAAFSCDRGEKPAGASSPPVEKKKPASKSALDDLLTFENQRRADTDFATLPPAGEVMGPDPYVLARLPGSELVVGLLRGDDAVVVIDAAGEEQQRLDAPDSPAGLAIAGDAVFVSSESSPVIHRYRIAPEGSLAFRDAIEVADVFGIADLAAGPRGVLYALDSYDGDLLAFRPGETPRTFGRCHRPRDVVFEAGFVLVNCLLDHQLRVYATDAGGMPRAAPLATIEHRGPMWSVDAAAAGGSLFVAAGGVEDHPLFRDGAFGFIDSFVFAYEINLATAHTERLLAENVSVHGVVTPKWVALSAKPGARLTIEAAGYGGEKRATLVLAGRGYRPSVTARPLPPGTADVVALGDGRFVAANPLLDAWVTGDGDGFDVRVVKSQKPGPARSLDVRVGEALFFTGLMAPRNKSTGRRSRFTCETCHFEGYVDGRTHYTTRGEVFSVTKPLRGLFNNRPHFSRALDRTMTQMVHNEFRVANAKSGRAPWFAIDVAGHGWLDTFGEVPQTLYATDLRRSLMAFLMVYTHDENPAVRGREGFTDIERRGAEVFAARCEGCHQARLVADAPDSRLPFARWEELIFSPSGPIVWASAAYKKTGVLPYVHPKGARVFSLRRVYRKWPYFTNGSAKTLHGVLEKVRYAGKPGDAGARFFHDGAPSGDGDLTSLSGDEIEALLAFLRLL